MVAGFQDYQHGSSPDKIGAGQINSQDDLAQVAEAEDQEQMNRTFYTQNNSSAGEINTDVNEIEIEQNRMANRTKPSLKRLAMLSKLE